MLLDLLEHVLPVLSQYVDQLLIESSIASSKGYTVADTPECHAVEGASILHNMIQSGIVRQILLSLTVLAEERDVVTTAVQALAILSKQIGTKRCSIRMARWSESSRSLLCHHCLAQCSLQRSRVPAALSAATLLHGTAGMHEHHLEQSTDSLVLARLA